MNRMSRYLELDAKLSDADCSLEFHIRYSQMVTNLEQEIATSMSLAREATNDSQKQVWLKRQQELKLLYDDFMDLIEYMCEMIAEDRDENAKHALEHTFNACQLFSHCAWKKAKKEFMPFWIGFRMGSLFASRKVKERG